MLFISCPYTTARTRSGGRIGVALRAHRRVETPTTHADCVPSEAVETREKATANTRALVGSVRLGCSVRCQICCERRSIIGLKRWADRCTRDSRGGMAWNLIQVVNSKMHKVGGDTVRLEQARKSSVEGSDGPPFCSFGRGIKSIRRPSSHVVWKQPILFLYQTIQPNYSHLNILPRTRFF